MIFSKVIDQKFLTIWVPCSVLSGLPSVQPLSLFMSSHDQDGMGGGGGLLEMSPSSGFFSLVLDYLDFCGGIFDL